MRILVVRPGPHFSVADVCRGWVEAFRRLGCQVHDFNFDQRLDFYTQAHVKLDDGGYRKALSDADARAVAQQGLEAASYRLWPDLVFVVSGFFVQEYIYELWRARGHRIVVLATESPYEDDAQLPLAGMADVLLLNDPQNIGAFREVNPNTFYQHHCYDPTVHRPGPADPDLACDFCFVGTGYQSRIDFFEQVDWDGLDVTLAGNWRQIHDGSPLRPFVKHQLEHCLDNSEAVRLYRAAGVSANLYRRESERPELADGWAMGPREVELAATGCFYLTEARPENRRVLPMVPAFDGPQEFEKLVRWYVERPDERKAIAGKAREAIADRTFEQSAQRLIAHLTNPSTKGEDLWPAYTAATECCTQR